MDTQLILGTTTSRRIRSALTALALLSIATIALVVGLYLWTKFRGGFPAINWFLAVLGVFTTLGLVGAMIISRYSPETILTIVAIGIACAAVAFLWGPLGIFWGLVAANIATSVVAWDRRRAGEP